MTLVLLLASPARQKGIIHSISLQILSTSFSNKSRKRSLRSMFSLWRFSAADVRKVRFFATLASDVSAVLGEVSERTPSQISLSLVFVCSGSCECLVNPDEDEHVDSGLTSGLLNMNLCIACTTKCNVTNHCVIANDYFGT